jgi:hypothetical protein
MRTQRASQHDAASGRARETAERAQLDRLTEPAEVHGLILHERGPMELEGIVVTET